MDSNIMLITILAIAIFGKANSVAVAVCILLIVKLLNLDQFIYPVIEKNGVSWGLILLTAAILIPIANGNVTVKNIKDVLASWIGITALILSFFTTYLSGLGLNYLTVQGNNDVIPAMIFGSVLAAVFLGGVPVGPLITSGILALLVKIIKKV
ncbi:protein of unknown function DUF441 [Proteiniborus sp. DW1]|uniref:DUF441 domain-containing protein n=1 Tax=Proteiniborus sp. DW1 TaxID=1889883 RepID=UPI00092DFBB6|nr:DUF441 domain-containing protein [Proteiniborus sp. DW1]SCG82780.1 protein of unknown function DUF441 [Proteiniborus sp. DW1]